jgi:phosphatidate phosphatase APP1
MDSKTSYSYSSSFLNTTNSTEATDMMRAASVNTDVEEVIHLDFDSSDNSNVNQIDCTSSNSSHKLSEDLTRRMEEHFAPYDPSCYALYSYEGDEFKFLNLNNSPNVNINVNLSISTTTTNQTLSNSVYTSNATGERNRTKTEKKIRINITGAHFKKIGKNKYIFK